MNFVLNLAVWVGAGWFVRMGGFGLVLVGIIDQSFIPIPGGIDAITIVLAASHPNTWPYYALMATVGTTIGALLTYALSKKGGKETLEKKLPRKTIKKVEQKFAKYGFSAVFVPCLLPPPLPAVPFLVGAGALQYPRRKFLLAVVLGRGIRYGIVAYLGHLFGDAILRFFKHYEFAIIGAFVVLMLGASVGGYVLRKWQLAKEARENQQVAGEAVAGAPARKPVPEPGLQKVAPLPPVHLH